MHHYIDIDKLRDFSKPITWDGVWDDLKSNYKITGVYDDDDESLTHLVDCLYYDYERKLINYRSYIEHGMLARMMMELRRSALLRFGDGLSWFYTEHSKFGTPKEVKEFRIKFCKEWLHPDFEDYHWQVYYACVLMWCGQFGDTIVDYEPCFEDCKYHYNSTVEEYEANFVTAHEPPRKPDGHYDWSATGSNPDRSSFR